MRRWIAAGLLVTGLGVVAVGLILDTGGPNADSVPLVAVIASLTVGALIVARVPGNIIGWLMVGSGLLSILAYLGFVLWEAYGVGAESPPTFAILGAWFGPIGTVAGFYLLLGFVLLFFPTGRLLSRRWLLLPVAGVVILAADSFLVAFHSEICVTIGTRCEVWIDNPMGLDWVPHREAQWVEWLGNIGGLVVLASFVSVVVRYRRSVGVERQQIKWLAFVAVFAAVVFVTGIVADNLGTQIPDWLWMTGFSLIPVAIGLAILRYRLYDIDRLISRSVVYAIVVALLFGVYAGGVVLLQTALPERGDLAVAASTLVAAVLFNPLRRRVQSFVDRRFYRSRYDAQRVVEEFSTRLRGEVDLEALTSDWVGVVQETVQPASVSVWVREAE